MWLSDWARSSNPALRPKGKKKKARSEKTSDLGILVFAVITAAVPRLCLVLLSVRLNAFTCMCTLKSLASGVCVYVCVLSLKH